MWCMLTSHSVVLADELESVLGFLYYNSSDANIARALWPANCSQAHVHTYTHTHTTHNHKRNTYLLKAHYKQPVHTRAYYTGPMPAPAHLAHVQKRTLHFQWAVVPGRALGDRVMASQSVASTGTLSDHSFQHVTLTLPSGFCCARCAWVQIPTTAFTLAAWYRTTDPTALSLEVTNRRTKPLPHLAH